jgi:hypothetical protein
MVDVGMILMPPIVIGREICLQIWNPLRLLKDHGPKRHLNIWKRKKSKETMEFIKVEEGSVQHNRYDGCYI